MVGFWLAVLGTALLLAFCTWGLLQLRALTGDQRPYTILYLIPVAVGAAFLGARGGMATALVAVVLARLYLLNGQQHGATLLLSAPTLNDDIEFLALLAGTFTVAGLTGRLRTALSLLREGSARLQQANEQLAETHSELETAHAQLLDSEQQRQAFNRDVLLAVTGGKLRLVEPSEMPPPDMTAGPPRLSLPLHEPQDASLLRQTLQRLGVETGMDAERVSDLCTGTTEAATNAIKHGSGGEARVWADGNAVAVLIADHGAGIAPMHLARATLEQGYSTRVSLGMGFHLMLQTADTLALSTGPYGTAILLRVSVGPRHSEEESLLARYAGL